MTARIHIPARPPTAAARLSGQLDRLAILLGVGPDSAVPPGSAGAILREIRESADGQRWCAAEAGILRLKAPVQALATPDARRHAARLLVGAAVLVDLAEHETAVATRQHITCQVEGLGRMALRVIRGGRP